MFIVYNFMPSFFNGSSGHLFLVFFVSTINFIVDILDLSILNNFRFSFLIFVDIEENTIFEVVLFSIV